MTDWTTTAPRPDPLRLRLESYPVIDEIAARYGETAAALLTEVNPGRIVGAAAAGAGRRVVSLPRFSARMSK